MTQEDILDIRRRALEDAAQLAYDMSEQNRVQALKLHLRSNKQAAAGFDEVWRRVYSYARAAHIAWLIAILRAVEAERARDLEWLERTTQGAPE